MTTAPTESLRRGRPRNEGLDREITAAALELLSESGFESFTVEAVCARTGVAKTTVYRRYPTRTDLIVGALERLNDDLPPVPAPGPVRDRLVAVLDGVRARAMRSRQGSLMLHAAAQGALEPRLAELVQSRVLAPRRELLRSVIADGVAAGELRDDVDPQVLIPILVGPMIYLGMWNQTSAACHVSVADIVDALLRGLTPATGS